MIVISVLRSKREISKSEFENSFKNLYEHSIKQTNNIPNRKKYWLATNIEGILVDTYLMIMELNEDIYRRHDCYYTEEELERFRNILIKLHDLEKPLIVLWNIENYEMKKMVSWAKLLQNSYNMVIKKSGIKWEYEFMVLDRVKMKEVKFLGNLSELHKYTHSKVINAPRMYDSNTGNIIIRLIDETLYLVCEANRKKPQTKKQYDKRCEKLEKAIKNLYMMQRSMLSYYNLVGYSERIYNEWSKMLMDEIKMLQGLQKSDKEKYSNLA